jgi:hypothetical protein
MAKQVVPFPRCCTTSLLSPGTLRWAIDHPHRRPSRHNVPDSHRGRYNHRVFLYSCAERTFPSACFVTVVPNCPLQAEAGYFPPLISYRYGQRGVEPHRQNGLGMEKDLLTVKELAAKFRMSPKSIQQAYRKGTTSGRSQNQPEDATLCAPVAGEFERGSERLG